MRLWNISISEEHLTIPFETNIRSGTWVNSIKLRQK